MAGTIAQLPYWEVRFDSDGSVQDDGGLPAQLAGSGVTELFVLSHGWNTSASSAQDLYQAMFTQLSALVGQFTPKLQGKVGAVGVLWPSLLFPDDDPATPAAPPASGAQLAAALAPAFPPAQQTSLTAIGSLLDQRPADPGKLEQCHQLIRGLVTTPAPAPEDAGEQSILDKPTAQVFGTLSALAKGPQSDAEGLPDPFTVLWHGARETLRCASYFEMKNRAGVVGQQGLGPLIGRVSAASADGLRVHLLGHSFGARLVAFALTGLPTAGPSPVKSLYLIQGAFSHFSFAAPMPIDAGRTGHLADVRGRVDGPLLATFSAADRAVGWWYPAASMLSHSDSESAVDLTYRWGGMGHDGYQQNDAQQLDLAAPGTAYPFQPGGCYRLKGDAVIAADQSAFSGAHSDIRHPEVLWAALSAATGIT